MPSTFSRSEEEFLTSALKEGGGMHFVLADSPPTRQDRVYEDVGHNLFPDQSLDICGGNEILLDTRKGVGQIGERAQQVSAAAGGDTDSNQTRGIPDVLDAQHGGGGEVVGAYEEGIMVQDLSAGRLVVGVVQANERVAEKGSETSARRFELGWRARVANDRGQVGAKLQFNVAGGIDDRRPTCFFASGEDGTG
jgi:hypothetical protein